MKTTMQNKIIAAVSLVCVLFLVNCRTQTGGTTALPPSPIEEFDLKMIEKVQAEALDIWKEEDKNLPIKPKPIVLIAPLFEDRFKGELCECLVESEHILQINLKGNTCAFDSGIVRPSGDFTLSGLAPGQYPYLCRIHPIMYGVVTVTDAFTPSQL